VLTCDGVVGPSNIPSSLTNGHGRCRCKSRLNTA